MIYLNNFFSSSIEKLAEKIFQKTKYGSIEVSFPSQKKFTFIGNNIGLKANIKLKNFSVIKKLLKKGAIGFAESYMDGDFTTTNLKNLLIFAEQNRISFLDFTKGKPFYKLFSKIGHYLRENNKSNSKKNISYHYDLGNKFYELWLDESMTYSSALFELPCDDLLSSQLNKYKKMIEPMKLNNKSSLLEIGCGWGGFSTFVGKNFDMKIDAITNSKQQFDYTSEKVMNEGLNDKINVELKDYRDIEKKYDNIVSIEMFEAVGKKYWPVYFKKIQECLNKNGLGTFQIITINENKREFYQKNPDFIQQYIFPGGILPSKKQLFELTSSLGLKLQEINSFGNSYAFTLKLWNEKFQNRWGEISEQGYTNRFKRMWEYYLSYCEAGFITKSTDVSQFLLKS